MFKKKQKGPDINEQILRVKNEKTARQIGEKGFVISKLNDTDNELLTNNIRRMEDELPNSGVLEKVDLGLITDSEIKKISVAEVQRIYSPNDSLAQTVNDLRFGTTERGVPCNTCRLNNVNCSGHFGHIDLHGLYYNPFVFTSKIITLVLNSVCHNCGVMILEPETVKRLNLNGMSQKLKLTKIAEASKNIPHINRKTLKEEYGCRRKNDISEDVVRIRKRMCEEFSKVQPLHAKSIRLNAFGFSGDVKLITKDNEDPIVMGVPNIDCKIDMCVTNLTATTSSESDDDQIFLKRDGGRGEAEPLPITSVYNILDQIPDEDAYLLGFHGVLDPTTGKYIMSSHPRDMIIKNLIVIPPCARPPAIQNGIVSSDKLTIAYNKILERTLIIKGTTDPKIRAEESVKVYRLIKSVMLLSDKDSTGRGGPQVDVNSIAVRLHGKAGLIRAAMMGKRVMYSGRTVLGPGPHLKFGEIGLPKEWAPVLTHPVKVTGFNHTDLQLLLRDGKVTHIIPKNAKIRGKRYVVSPEVKEKYVLHVGDTVFRHLQDGDYVCFNRQPSLHKYSFMGYKTVLHTDKTIKLPLPCTTPHNADFDGDEGNIHKPQTIEAMVETQNILNVVKCILGTKNNSPSMGVVYDGLSGWYIITLPGMRVPERIFKDCLSKITAKDTLTDFEERLKKYKIPYRYPDGMYNGRALFSAILPTGFNAIYGDGSSEILIKEGILMDTTSSIEKQHIGGSTGSIVHLLAVDYSEERAGEFLTDASRLADIFLMWYGFSIGITDCLLPKDSDKYKVEKEIAKTRDEVFAMGNPPKDALELIRYELEITGKVQTAKSIGAIIAREFPSTHPLKVMTASGAKGNDSNTGMICGVIGQQLINDKRIEMTISHNRRCLPVFALNDGSIESRGFITNTFSDGLTMYEAFFHQAAGRTGLIDTALKTGETGTVERNTIKYTENLVIGEGGIVRNMTGHIFESAYGGDGLDPRYLFSDKGTQNFVQYNRLETELKALFGF